MLKPGVFFGGERVNPLPYNKIIEWYKLKASMCELDNN